MPVTVVDPIDLLRLFQAHLQEIPELLALVGGDPQSIGLHDREGDLAGAIENIRPPSLYIYWDGIQPTRFPNRFKYLVGVVLRLKFPAVAFQAMTQGTSLYSGSDGLPMLSTTIHPQFDAMELPSVERLQIAIGDRSRVIECMAFKTAFADRGSR